MPTHKYKVGDVVEPVEDTTTFKKSHPGKIAKLAPYGEYDVRHTCQCGCGGMSTSLRLSEDLIQLVGENKKKYLASYAALGVGVCEFNFSAPNKEEAEERAELFRIGATHDADRIYIHNRLEIPKGDKRPITLYVTEVGQP